MDIHKCMALVADKMQLKFTINNKPISSLEVFAENGMFPAIIKRADQLSCFCLGTGLGIKVEEFAASMMGTKAIMDNSVSNAYRIMCMTEILCELTESSPNPRLLALDNLMYD
ncbi:MAG: type IV secretion protein IcmS [Gammaproteobacteria bacterium]|nr:type IV secretion protein IcmS [Gammaproteobacteria bacterium]